MSTVEMQSSLYASASNMLVEVFIVVPSHGHPGRFPVMVEDRALLLGSLSNDSWSTGGAHVLTSEYINQWHMLQEQVLSWATAVLDSDPTQ